MKTFFSLTSAAVFFVSLCACHKPAQDPNTLDYYKNKIITLRLSSDDMTDGDQVLFRMSATGIGDRQGSTPPLIVNGKLSSEKVVEVNADMVSDGVTIQTADPAWQITCEYTWQPDASPFHINVDASFDDKVQETNRIRIEQARSGVLEIKEYR